MIANPKGTGDPFLDQLNGMISQAQMLRDEYIRDREAQVRERAGLIDAARSIARADEMTSAEAAKYLNVSLSAINHAGAGTACLYRARIKNGRKVTHLRRRVELHRENIEQFNECGVCDQETFERFPRRIK